MNIIDEFKEWAVPLYKDPKAQENSKFDRVFFNQHACAIFMLTIDAQNIVATQLNQGSDINSITVSYKTVFNISTGEYDRLSDAMIFSSKDVWLAKEALILHPSMRAIDF